MENANTANYNFPGIDSFLNGISDPTRELDRRFANVFDAILNVSELAMQIYCASTIKFYENRIVKPEKEYEKKVKPIQESLAIRFTAPSLGTHLELARLCGHIIDSSAPIELKKMKSTLVQETFAIGKISTLLKQINELFAKSIEIEAEENQAKILHTPATKWTLMQVLMEFKHFRNDSAHLTHIRNIIEDNIDDLSVDISLWEDAFYSILNSLSPFLKNKFREKRLGEITSKGDLRLINILNKDFYENKISESKDSILLEEWLENQWDNLTQIVLHNDEKREVSLDIYPFILLQKDVLTFYKRTKASGYQYYSIATNTTYSKPTKKKFSNTIFKIYSQASQQALFWSEAIPIYNDTKTVKANIPTQGNSRFIGRRKQITRIKEEIIEIPNQNGFIYGVGGVGKTALAIELTKQLFQEDTAVNYPNIIWVSAKTNFYNPILDSVENRQQNINTLKDILSLMLVFFEYEGAEEYNIDELKEIVLDLLIENKVLLIIDNFETLQKAEAKTIVDFFQIAVKRHLKNYPFNFKIIMTSRELFPSGCHQINLEGLDYKDSKNLMKDLLNYYVGNSLTEDQFKLIHKVTFGIPIVIKHFFGQLFEFNKPFDTIIQGLNGNENEVIKFSYSEIFALLKKDEIMLKVIVLIELLSEPMSARQISDILEIPQNDIVSKLPILLNFQCLERINIGIDEKYMVNQQVGLLSKSLVKDFANLTVEIRQKISHNLTVDRKMDYTREEFEIIELFKKDIDDKRYIAAEAFLKDEIRKHPTSTLLKFNWAKYLLDIGGQTSEAIKILEEIITDNVNQRNPTILHSLAKCYVKLDVPNYDKASIYYKELLGLSNEDEIKFEIAEFYINWSSFLKRRSKEMDPLKDFERRIAYKEIANDGLKLLQEIKTMPRDHFYYFLSSVAYHNKWLPDKALDSIEQALNLAKGDPFSTQKYTFHRNKVTQYIKYK